ncbi:unnamed protein product, partial [Candidula unifasciata]
LQDIRLGVLLDSAVHGVLKNGGSKLAHVAERNPVPKTDVGIDWVIKGKLDALLGDYSILDYARAHLAPSCELKLISKLFGEDRYGLGLPKDSPLKAALSSKISEYHLTGYIDDLIDVHFADAHCIKKRISEEDSQLEVTHHAGLFVMLCVGIGIGVLVLLLEHVIYKFLVPYIRKSPASSRWRSIHLMFVSQRNKLADMARTKRINRNFYDIVEKAKWLKEMQDSGLTDDEGQPNSTIIEIPLKKLTVNIEMGSSSLNMGGEMDSLLLRKSSLAANSRKNSLAANSRKSSLAADSRKCSLAANSRKNSLVANSAQVISNDEASSPESDDSLLGRNEDEAGKRLPDTFRSSPVLPKLLVSSHSTSLHLQEMHSSDNHYRFLHAGYASSSALDHISNNNDHLDSCSQFNYDLYMQTRRGSADCSDIPVLSINSPPNNTRQRLASGSSLPSAFVVNELSSLYRTEHQPHSANTNSATGRAKLPVCLHNTLPKSMPALGCGKFAKNTEIINGDEENGRHEMCDESVPVINDNLHMHPFSDESYNPAGIGASASNYINKSLLQKTNNVSLAQSFLQKPQTQQDHMCSAAESAQAEASQDTFCLDTVTKEELLVLWKSSEIELHKRLKAALKEKSRLERKLEMLQIHSLV